MRNFEQTARRRYLAEFISAIALYVTLGFLTRRLLPGLESEIARVVVSLLPLTGLVLAIWAFARGFLRLDEFLRRMVLETLAWGVALSMLITMGYVYLEIGIGLPRLSIFWSLPVTTLCWGGAAVLYKLIGRAQVLWL